MSNLSPSGLFFKDPLSSVSLTPGPVVFLRVFASPSQNWLRASWRRFSTSLVGDTGLTCANLVRNTMLMPRTLAGPSPSFIGVYHFCNEYVC